MPLKQSPRSLAQSNLQAEHQAFERFSGMEDAGGSRYGLPSSPLRSPMAANPRSPTLLATTNSHPGFMSSPDLSRQPSNAHNLIQRFNSLDSVAQSHQPTRPPSSPKITGGMTHLLPPSNTLMDLQSPLSVTNTAQLPVLRTSYSETDFPESGTMKSSFKSFFGALGWKRDPEFKAIRYRPRDVIPETDSEHSGALPSPSHASHSPAKSNDMPQEPVTRQDAAQLLPYDEPARKTGLLLCLQSEYSWLPSLVTLTSTRLRIEPQIPDSIGPSDLLLAFCADVRSLSSKETQDILGSAPLQDGDAQHLFELEFLERPPRRFAAQSITERGSWVSSIWDSILASKNVTVTPQMRQSETLVNPHSDIASSPNISYKQPLGALRVTNASSSSSDEKSASPTSAGTGKEKSLPPPPPSSSDVTTRSELRSGTGSVHAALRHLQANSIYLTIPASSTSQFGSNRSTSIRPPVSLVAPSVSLVQERLTELKGVRHAYDGSSGASSASQSSVVPMSSISPESSVSRTYSVTRKIRALDHLEENTQLKRSGSLSSSSTDYQRRLRELEYSSASSYSTQIERRHTNRSAMTTWSAESAPDLDRILRREGSVSDVIVFPPTETQPWNNTVEDEFPVAPRQSTIDPSQVLRNHPPRPPTLVASESEIIKSARLAPPQPVQQLPAASEVSFNVDGSDVNSLLGKIETLRPYLENSRSHNLDPELEQLVDNIKELGTGKKAFAYDIQAQQRALPIAHSQPNEVKLMEGQTPLANSETPKVVPSTPNGEFLPPQRTPQDPVVTLANLTALDPSVAVKLPELLDGLQQLLSRQPLPRDPSPAPAPTIDLQPILNKIESCFQSNRANNPSDETPSTDDKPHVDLSQLSDKIEALSAACMKSIHSGSSSFMKDTFADGQQEMMMKIQDIHDVTKAGAERGAMLEKQTAESSKYLNDLNKWLETVVQTNGNSIQSMSAGVAGLTKELLGPPTDTLQDASASEGQAPTPKGLAQEMRQFMKERQEHEQKMETLHESVQDLLQQLKSEAAERSHQVLLEQQRVCFEGIVKDVAAHLSTEIRAEQSRFIDAMQQATTIHVNQQVASFREYMVNEVGKMTQDVLRLQRERQTVEGQLSELFGFLSKQQRVVGTEANPQASGRPTPGADGKKQAGGVRQLPGAMPAHASLVKRAATQR